MTRPPKSTAETLLEEIEAFTAAHNMAATTFGKRACGDAHLVAYLRSGRSITTRRLDLCRAFMRDYKPAEQKVGKRNNDTVTTDEIGA